MSLDIMLKETTCVTNNNEARERVSLSTTRLPPVDELTIGLKQKLHLRARTRAAPYYVKKTEPLDLVERLLQERALVAEAVRRLQALETHAAATEARTCRPCFIEYKNESL